MANFGAIVEWALRLEDRTLRGRTVDLGDGAGLTRFGITSKNNPDVPASFFTEPVAEALEHAKQFYWSHDWRVIRGADIQSDDVASVLMSWHLTSGEHAIKGLQGMLLVNMDGKMGPATLSAVNHGIASQIASALREAQEQFYQHIADPRFVGGWVKRARAVYPDLPQ